MSIQLTDEQDSIINLAIKWFNNDSSQTFELSGSAGTGKSLVLHEIVKRLGLKDLEYVAAAYTGAAAIVMRRNNFDKASTIHSLLYQFVEGKDPLTGKKVKHFIWRGVPSFVKLIIIDEAGMCDMNIRRDLERTGKKILVAGDINQLPPVSGSQAYFTDTSKVHFLTKIMRQNQDSAIVFLSQALLQGKRLKEGVYGNGEVIVLPRKEFKENIEDCIRVYGTILCGMNKTRDELNKLVREDVLGYDNPLPYIGERLINRKNIWELEIDDGIALVNGTIGRSLNNVDQSRYRKGMFVIDFKPDYTRDYFKDLEVDYEYFIANSNRRKEIKELVYSDGAKMEYAYACTTHVAQGSQFDTGIYYQEYFPKDSNNLHYTGITRFRNKMLFVIPDYRRIYSADTTFKGYKCDVLIPIEKVK